jgi:hypothetical protein
MNTRDDDAADNGAAVRVTAVKIEIFHLQININTVIRTARNNAHQCYYSFLVNDGTFYKVADPG